MGWNYLSITVAPSTFGNGWIISAHTLLSMRFLFIHAGCKLIPVSKRVLSLQWARWRLKPPATRLFAQTFIQAQIKGNIKALRHWPFLGEFTGHLRIPRTNGQWRGKCFHSMTSSWCGVKSITVAPLKFGNGWIISAHTLLGMRLLLIHAGCKLIPVAPFTNMV